MPTPTDVVPTAAVTEFLYREAQALDRGDFERWFAMFAPDARYLIPSTDRPDADPDLHLFIVNDDIVRLRGRVDRMLSRNAHANFPRPRTRHMIGNVLVDSTDEGLVAESNLVVHTHRRGEGHVFVGECRHDLRRVDDSFEIVRKRINLDLESLAEAGGKINFIL